MGNKLEVTVWKLTDGQIVFYEPEVEAPEGAVLVIALAELPLTIVEGFYFLSPSSKGSS